MSLIEQLDKVIATHVLPLAQRHQWKEMNSQASSMGALRDYVAGNLYIRVVNDRGLVDIEIGSVHKRKDLRCASFFKDLLAPPRKGAGTSQLSSNASSWRTNGIGSMTV